MSYSILNSNVLVDAIHVKSVYCKELISFIFITKSLVLLLNSVKLKFTHVIMQLGFLKLKPVSLHLLVVECS